MKKAPPKEFDTIETLKARIGALRARQRELGAELLVTDAAGETVAATGGFTRAAAERLAAGEIFEALADGGAERESAPRSAGLIRAEIALIDQAIGIMDGKIRQAELRRAEDEYRRRGHEFRGNMRDTALAICALQRLNRERNQLAREIDRFNLIRIPGANFPAVKIGGDGLGAANGFTQFFDLVLSLGILSREELDKARGINLEVF
jgi:hypothetical protein